MMTRDRIFAARDPHGFRPLSMGRMKNPGGPDTVVFASESCAFDLLRAEFVRDILPGELVMVSEDGVTSRQYASGIPQSSCIFEHVYFARPDSRIFGRWVQESRDQMGRQLARESGVPADVVVPVPDSGVTAALGYAEEAGIPFRFGLIRNHYVGRTFIEPEQRVRDFGVRLKLNPVHNLLAGKRVILIDDSIIRGTTSRKIVRMVRGAGATEVHLRISCPPTISPCFYGVDTPSKKELIAANHSVEEIRHYIEADSLAYLSLDGLLQCVRDENKRGLLHGLLHRQLSHAMGRCGRHPARGGEFVAAKRFLSRPLAAQEPLAACVSPNGEVFPPLNLRASISSGHAHDDDGCHSGFVRPPALDRTRDLRRALDPRPPCLDYAAHSFVIVGNRRGSRSLALPAYTRGTVFRNSRWSRRLPG